MPHENQAAIDRLCDVLNEAAATLPDVRPRKMMGAYTLFSDHGIFAIVLSDQRIALRLPDEAAYQAMAATLGSEVWRFEPDSKPVKHWLRIPASFHNDPDQLAGWVRRAYELSLQQPTSKRGKRNG